MRIRRLLLILMLLVAHHVATCMALGYSCLNAFLHISYLVTQGILLLPHIFLISHNERNYLFVSRKEKHVLLWVFLHMHNRSFISSVPVHVHLNHDTDNAMVPIQGEKRKFQSTIWDPLRKLIL